MEPVAALAEDGSNVALKVVLAPAARVVDVLRPVCAKPVPETAIWVKVSVALPPFFKVMGKVSVVPSATVPKLTLDGLAEISACRPVPVSAIVVGEAAALLVMLIVPAALPAVVGVKATVKLALEPALTETG